ncbi:MAG TPA: hypothetical protein VFQ88_07315 [Nevskiaceae bacterium]|nr:hypothetical protein [Nevskiaceae bacterium]
MVEHQETEAQPAKPVAEAIAAPVAMEASLPKIARIAAVQDVTERPDVLTGSTYKIKSPMAEHAFYITINDLVEDGPGGQVRQPFEIFINSKNMEQFQWIVALTRMVSAVFRKGGDMTFLAEEMKAVFDPRGGYFKPGGKFMPSIVAEIGDVIERHLKSIGLIGERQLDASQVELIAAKRAAYEERTAQRKTVPAEVKEAAKGDASQFPPGATECPKCHVRAMVHLDNCVTCLSCAFSKCG